MLNSYAVICAFIAFFPWVSFGLNSYDTQPWFLIAALPFLVYALTLKSLFNFYVLALLLIIFILALMSGGESIGFLVRTLGTYLSLACSIILFSKYIRFNQSIRIWVLILTNLIWLAYSLLEFFQADSLPVLSNSRSSDDRGISSLSVEPTFYGIFLIFQIMIASLEQHIYKNKNNQAHFGLVFIVAVNVFQLIFLAKSSLAILILMLLITAWLLIFRTIIFTTLILTSLLILTPFALAFILSIDAQSRPILMLQEFINNPAGIIYNDMSIAERISAIYISIGGSVSNLLVPHGFDQYGFVAKSILSEHDWLQSYDTNIIMSFIGGVLFELGFFALPILLYPFFIFGMPVKIKIFWLFSLFIVFINAIPVGLPLTGYLLALLKLSYSKQYH